MTETKYSEAAKDCFVHLCAVWEKWIQDNPWAWSWQAGTTFDALLDYVLYRQNPDNIKKANELADLGLTSFKNGDQDWIWWDDFGWWGIAFLKAYQLCGKNPKYLEAAEKAWTKMDAGRRVWKDIVKNGWQSDFAVREPRYLGGVWNKGASSSKDWPKPEGYGSDRFKGIQNAVTNGLYLVLSLRLSRIPESKIHSDCRKGADTVYGWLEKWYGVDLLSPDGDSLIEERVSYYKVEPVPFYSLGAAWAGDQGLLLGTLSEYLIIDKKDQQKSELANRLARRVREALVDSYGLMMPWRDPSDRPQDSQGAMHSDAGDYCTGVGIYMRYFVYAAHHSILVDPVAQFGTFLTQNADVVKDPDHLRIHQLECNYSNPYGMNSLAHQLEILNAADVVLG
jgi:hypothetical protein